MEVQLLRNRPVVQFLGGLLTVLIANILGGTLGGYIITLFWVGPHPIWEPIDKNVGLSAAIFGILAGVVVGMIGLAGFSSHRHSWAPFLGGCFAAALELAVFLFEVTARQ